MTEHDSLLTLKELYKEQLEKSPHNIYYSVRLLQDVLLQENDFEAEDINLLRIMVDRLLDKSPKMKTAFFKAIQKEIEKIT